MAIEYKDLQGKFVKGKISESIYYVFTDDNLKDLGLQHA